MTEIIAPIIPVTKIAVSDCCLMAMAINAQAMVSGYKIFSNPRRTAIAKIVAMAMTTHAAMTEILAGNANPTKISAIVTFKIVAAVIQPK